MITFECTKKIVFISHANLSTECSLYVGILYKKFWSHELELNLTLLKTLSNNYVVKNGILLAKKRARKRRAA